MKKEELRVIPSKNYIILGIVIIVTILLQYCFYMWVNIYNESKINKPILDKYLDIINYNELNDYIIENQDGIIYTSVLMDEDIRDFEIKFKNRIRSGKLDKEVFYMDITNELKDMNTIKDMQGKYSLEYAKITDVPCLIIFEDGKLKSIYSIKDNEYDVDKMIEYINNIKFQDEEISK